MGHTRPTKVIRVGVLGVGNMGRHHARIYAQMQGVELVGIADPDPELCENIAQQLHTRAFQDHRSLLDCGLDGVSIAVPTSMHREVALNVIRSGTASLIEKPIAGTLEDGQMIVEEAAYYGVLLMIGHVERFNPAIETLEASTSSS